MNIIKLLSFCAAIIFANSLKTYAQCTELDSFYTNLYGELPCNATCGTSAETPEVWSNEGYELGTLTAGSEYVFTLGASTGWSPTITVAAWDTVSNVVGDVVDFVDGRSLTVTIPTDGDYIVILSVTGSCTGSASNGIDNGALSVDCGAGGAICPCLSTTGIDTRTECNSFTWIDGVNYTSSNNTATYNIVNGAANGCDSLVTLDLTINNVTNITTSVSGQTIIAANGNASYQWLDCENNYSIIPSEINQGYTPATNGNYAVELTENGCLDTSDCVVIATIGLVENSFGNKLNIYPNPTKGNFSIDLGDLYGASEVLITDLSGKLIDSKTMIQSQILNLSIEEPAGIYIVSIQSGDKRAVFRLTKE